jgi:hypothetical protein
MVQTLRRRRDVSMAQRPLAQAGMVAILRQKSVAPLSWRTFDVEARNRKSTHSQMMTTTKGESNIVH